MIIFYSKKGSPKFFTPLISALVFFGVQTGAIAQSNSADSAPANGFSQLFYDGFMYSNNPKPEDVEKQKKAKEDAEFSRKSQIIQRNYYKCIDSKIEAYKDVRADSYEILAALNGDCPMEYYGIEVLADIMGKSKSIFKEQINNQVIRKIVKMRSKAP